MDADRPDLLKYELPSLKQWIQTQPDMEDGIDAKYNEFKSDRVRGLVVEIFDEYRRTQWFKDMYHPAHAADKSWTGDRVASTKARLAAFQALDEDGRLDVTLGGDENKDAVASVLSAACAILDPCDGSDDSKGAAKAPENGDGDDDGDSGEVVDDEDDAKTASATAEDKAVTKAEDGEIVEDAADNAAEDTAAADSAKPRRFIAFLLQKIPSDLPAGKLKAALDGIEGFVRLHVALPPQSSVRRAVASFVPSSISAIESKLNGIELDGFSEKLQWRSFTPRPPSTRVAGDFCIRTHAGDAELLNSLITLFDKKYNLFPEGEATNPVLAEGVSDDKKILFLRIVYSFDFYSGTELPLEANFPVQMEYVTIRKDNEKLSTLPSKKHWRDAVKSRLAAEEDISAEMAEKLKRTKDTVRTAFIKANVKKVKMKDGAVAFECQLLFNSKKKKFQTEEFAQKHVTSKHAEKVAAIESDAVMFNSYLADPLRIRSVPRTPSAVGGGSVSGGPGRSPGMMFSPPGPRGGPMMQPMMMGGGGRGGGGPGFGMPLRGGFMGGPGIRPPMNRGVMSFNSPLPRGPPGRRF